MTMIRFLFLALLTVVGMAAVAQAREVYYPGVDQPPLGGTHWTFGPALVYGGSRPDAHALPGSFSSWSSDVLVPPSPQMPHVSGFRGLFQRFRRSAPALHHQHHAPPAHWHSNHFGY